MLGRWEIVLATLCRACRTSFGLWNVCCSESQCFAESCQKEAHCNVLRQIAQILESNQLCKRASETRLQRKRGSLPHTPWFVLGSLCLGTSLLIFCEGSAALMQFGRWERAMRTGRLQRLGFGMSVFQKNYSWRKGSLLVYDPTFHHLGFSKSWIRMWSSGRRSFLFSEPGGNHLPD